jgi:hypothetical protein
MSDGEAANIRNFFIVYSFAESNRRVRAKGRSRNREDLCRVYQGNHGSYYYLTSSALVDPNAHE